MVGSPPSISRVSGLRSRPNWEETGPDTHIGSLQDHPAGSSSSACQSHTQLLHWVSKPHWILGNGVSQKVSIPPPPPLLPQA